MDDSIAIWRRPKICIFASKTNIKRDALAHFVEGMSFEENGEMEKALAAYRKVLDVDPGQIDLAAPRRVIAHAAGRFSRKRSTF